MVLPTAHTPVPPAATPDSESAAPAAPGLGLGTTCQDPSAPSSVSVRGGFGPILRLPTAQAVVNVAVTALRESSRSGPPGSGLLTNVQRRPFQCSMSVCSAWPFQYCPTAHALSGDVAATPFSTSRPAVPPALGLGTSFQPTPFQCSISVRTEPPFA